MTWMNPRSPAGALLLLVAAAVMPSPGVADEGDPPAPAPAGPAEEPASAGAPPLRTIEQAWNRMEALRQAPLSSPGLFLRRRERIRKLATDALALPEAKGAAGEDLFRLSALAFEAERYPEAGDCAARYLAGGGKEPLPHAGQAHATRVRALARLGKFEEADGALKAWREAMPKAEGIPPVLKTLGDAFVAAGKVEESLARYREAFDRASRPLKAAAATVVQGLVEALVATGRAEEATRAVKKAREDSDGSEAFVARLDAMERRLRWTGEPFPLPKLELWCGAAAPEPAALEGKVVAWHFFAWWMEARLGDLDAWTARAAAGTEKGFLLFPVTRFSGWDTKAGRFDPYRKPGEEFPGIEGLLKARGWKGPFAVAAREGRAFDDLGIRGLPMDIVVGRDGKVLFAQAGEEAGPALARWVAERALAAPAPPPPGPPRPESR